MNIKKVNFIRADRGEMAEMRIINRNECDEIRC